MRHIIIIFLVSCALHFSSAQETYGMRINADTSPLSYELYSVDFFSGTYQFLFSIGEDRFYHPDTTGFRDDIIAFEFNKERSAVYFQEIEGDLYHYDISGDQLTYLGDMTPENTDFLFYGYTQINQIFFLNDSLLYCAGFTWGIYNIHTGIFQKIRQPANHPIAGTEREQELDCKKIVKHKGEFIYISNNVRLMSADLMNPDNNQMLYDLSVLHGFYNADIISWQYDCDSTDLFIYRRQVNEQEKGFYKFDISTGQFEFSLPLPGPFYTVKHYNDLEWEDCQTHIDLDEDNSTATEQDYLDTGLCYHTDIPLSDIDVLVRNEYPMDSIIIQILNPFGMEYLTFPTGNYFLPENDVPVIRIINNGTTLNTEFEDAIRNARYFNDSDPQGGEIKIEFTPWFDSIPGNTATTTIQITEPLPFAGRDTSIDICADNEITSLFALIDPDSDVSGEFYDHDFLSIDDSLTFPDEDTLYLHFISIIELCYDTADVEIIVRPSPDDPMLTDEVICAEDTLWVDVSGIADDFLWYDGSQNPLKDFSESGIFWISISNAYNCSLCDSFSLSVLPHAVIEPVDTQTCYGNTFVFLDNTYSIPGNYRDTLLNSRSCDSVIYDIQYSFLDYQPFEFEGEFGFCEGEQTSIQVISSHLQLSVDDSPFDQIIQLDQPGEYILRGMDSNGCPDSLEFFIESWPSPVVVTEDLIDLPVAFPVSIPVHYQGNIVSYIWSPDVGLSCGDCPFPEILQKQEGIYRIQVENEFGCKASDQLQISFLKNNYYLPNTLPIHPVVDDNDIFFLQSNTLVNYDLFIFDRWGGAVFSRQYISANDKNSGWHPGSSVNQGVYVYMIRIYEYGREVILSGDVTVY